MEADGMLVYARGVWGPDVEKEILDALRRWEESALPLSWSRMLFYCYYCGFPKYASEKMLLYGQRPRCPICSEKMDAYDADRLRRWRRELADRTRAVLGRALRIFSEAADKCGGVKGWALLTSGVLEVSSNCGKFWYDPRSWARQSVKAVLYGTALCGNVREVEKALKRVVSEMNVWLFYTIK